MELFVSPSADSQYVCYHSAFCGDGDPRPVFVLGRTAEDCCGQPNVMSARPREIGAAENCSSCGEGLFVCCTLYVCDERNLAVSVSSLFLYSVEFVSTHYTEEDVYQLHPSSSLLPSMQVLLPWNVWPLATQQ